MPYKLFPYERRLGIRELESLGFGELSDEADAVTGVGDTAVAVHRATYFERIANGCATDALTEQATVELAHLDLREGQRRQATRYGLHGIHEYKGKFNPQVVRALCNIVDVDAEVLLDPFCGSGTALIEGLRLGMNVVGIDSSPVAHFLAGAKLRATTADSKAALAEELLAFGNEVAAALTKGQEGDHPAAEGSGLSASARAYLQRWFTPPAFAGVSRALAVIEKEPDSTRRELIRVALSSILRGVSLQLPEDLRIRRRPEPFTAPPMAPLFLEGVESIRRGLLEMDKWPPVTGAWALVHRSAEEASAYDAAAGTGRRLILTSPPYATALPYIDTDRLSIVALGLGDASDLASVERSLIGSREWTRAQQREWDARRLANADRLPVSIEGLVQEIHERNQEGGGGFRRQAVPSLLYRYFARMATTIESWGEALDVGESAVLIVGHNHTTAGGDRIDITTPELLGHAAETRGFVVSEIMKLEAWPRYGLHAANGVPSEDALVLRRVS